MSTGIMTTPGCKNMEAELAALLPLDNDKVNPRHPAPARTPTQSAGLSRVAYVSIALTLVLAAFLLGKFNRPYTTQTDDAAFNRAMDAGVRLTAAEEKALNDRFEARDRAIAVLHTVPAYLTEEIDAMWPELSAGTNPYFAAAYLVERHREAVLWSFFVELADKDGSGGYSYEERQDYLRLLGGKVDGHNLQLKECSVGLVDCFGGIDYFEYEGPEENLLEPHYLFEWVAFANTKCTSCLFNATQASGPPLDAGPSDRPKLDCVLGGTETMWEEADFSWPACSVEVDGISKDDMARGLVEKYAYTIINEDSSGGLHLKLAAS